MTKGHVKIIVACRVHCVMISLQIFEHHLQTYRANLWLQILLVEFLPRRKRSWCVVVPFDATRSNNSNKEACYRILAVFFFGLAITQLLTEIGKYSVGRLRPHFLSVCSPQNLPLNCSNIFIVQDVCTGDSPDKIKEARFDFYFSLDYMQFLFWPVF